MIIIGGLESTASLMFETKCHRENDRTDGGIISCVSCKMIFTGEIHLVHAKPNLLIVCIIDEFLQQ